MTMETRRSSKQKLATPPARHVDIDRGDAFLPDFRRGFVPAKDGDVEAFGEEFIVAATSAEAVAEAARDDLADEEYGMHAVDPSADDAADESAV